LQTEPGSIACSHERCDLAFTIECWIPFRQRATRPPQNGWETWVGRVLPWRIGRCDVTIADSVMASYLNLTSSCAGSAAEAAATRKEETYSEISSNYLFFPLAFETFGSTNQAGCDFVYFLSRRLLSRAAKLTETCDGAT